MDPEYPSHWQGTDKYTVIINSIWLCHQVLHTSQGNAYKPWGQNGISSIWTCEVPKSWARTREPAESNQHNPLLLVYMVWFGLLHPVQPMSRLLLQQGHLRWRPSPRTAVPLTREAAMSPPPVIAPHAARSPATVRPPTTSTLAAASPCTWQTPTAAMTPTLRWAYAAAASPRRPWPCPWQHTLANGNSSSARHATSLRPAASLRGRRLGHQRDLCNLALPPRASWAVPPWNLVLPTSQGTNAMPVSCQCAWLSRSAFFSHWGNSLTCETKPPKPDNLVLGWVNQLNRLKLLLNTPTWNYQVYLETALDRSFKQDIKSLAPCTHS